MIILEKLQKRAVKWICGRGKYGQKLRFLNILPLPMHIQILNLLTLSNFCTKFCTSNPTTVTLLQSQTASSRTKEVFKLPKTRTEKARNEFVFRTSRLANKVTQHANIEEPVGLKRRLIELFWRVVEATYDELNSCTRLIACDCQNCREKWTFF